VYILYAPQWVIRFAHFPQQFSKDIPIKHCKTVTTCMEAKRIVDFTPKFETGISQYWVAPNFTVPQVKIFIYLRFSFSDYKSVISVLNLFYPIFTGHTSHYCSWACAWYRWKGIEFFNANTIITNLKQGYLPRRIKRLKIPHSQIINCYLEL
jgi:hypothetical protein